MLGALRAGVKQMMVSQRSGATRCRRSFEAEFYPRLGVEPDPLRKRLIAISIARCFQPCVGARANAPVHASWWIGQCRPGTTWRLPPIRSSRCMATNERVRWAGLDPACFELISSFETFHFTKTHPAYFAEMLGRLGWPDEPVVMAGNDVERDLGTAGTAGLDDLSRRDVRERPTRERSGNLRQLRRMDRGRTSRACKPPVFQTPRGGPGGAGGHARLRCRA